MCDLSQVHFDCKFRGIDVVSSRSARLLGGNRSIAEVGLKSAMIPLEHAVMYLEAYTINAFYSLSHSLLVIHWASAQG